jgi:HAD superfamily hydrolase (TIGR01490 family)
MVHIFDVDKTIVKNTSAWYFLRQALSERLIRFSQVRRLLMDCLKYAFGRPNMNFIEDAVKHLKGIEKKKLDQAAQNCFERYIMPNIYADAARLISEALGRNERVVFATASLGTIIQPLEKFLVTDSSIASALEFQDGKTTGRGSSLFGAKKKDAVQAWLEENRLPPGEACFYSDSYTDIPLLEYCGRPVAVNPDRILRQEAKKRGWEILRFTKTLGKQPAN